MNYAEYVQLTGDLRIFSKQNFVSKWSAIPLIRYILCLALSSICQKVITRVCVYVVVCSQITAPPRGPPIPELFQ